MTKTSSKYRIKIRTVDGTRSQGGELSRSTAYYYGDLEKLKRQKPLEDVPEQRQETSEICEIVPQRNVMEAPRLVEVGRQWSLPEYTTPESSRKIEETYSTAGTFPMPEPKEKEPLLAELEVVGRLPLTQLESSSVVRRSRSWYLCCPNVGDEEISRESSWRYSSLRPVTAAPIPGQNGLMVATQSTARDDVTALKAERDALARALAAERQRAATAARAHDARLAELHGVIAELVRRRADKQARAIPEEDGSDECESTTQPAEELDNDADPSRTEQNDTSSLASPAELPAPRGPTAGDAPDDVTDASGDDHSRPCNPTIEVTSSQQVTDCDTSLNLSERDSELCLTTARCCRAARQPRSAGDSCERQRGSPASRGRSETRRAKLASRVRLRTADSRDPSTDEAWSLEAERLAQDVCAQADLREALVAAGNDGEALSASVEALKAHCRKLEADNAVTQAALEQATDVVHRLYTFCSVQESWVVQLCAALRAADRTVEAYDVLLALAETERRAAPHQREAAELVARQLLARLDAEQRCATIGEPLLSPGPWLEHDNNAEAGGAWGGQQEASLRRHVAALKSSAAALRDCRPALYSQHDGAEELSGGAADYRLMQMEAAIVLQESAQLKERVDSSRLCEGAAPRPPPDARRCSDAIDKRNLESKGLRSDVRASNVANNYSF